MKISDLFGRNSVQNSAKAEKSADAKNSSRQTLPDDRSTISDKAVELYNLSNSKGYVGELKKKIAAGNYNVSSTDVAKKIKEKLLDS